MCLSRFLFCVFLTLSYPGGSWSVVELTPSTSLSVCPGEQVVIKCTASISATFVAWSVELATRSRERIHLPFLSGSRNDSLVHDSMTGLTFHAELISLAPACSTFVTTATLALDNTQVTCRESTTSANTVTIYLKGTVVLHNIILCNRLK